MAFTISEAYIRVDGDGTPEEVAAQIEKEWTT